MTQDLILEEHLKSRTTEDIGYEWRGPRLVTSRLWSTCLDFGSRGRRRSITTRGGSETTSNGWLDLRWWVTSVDKIRYGNGSILQEDCPRRGLDKKRPLQSTRHETVYPYKIHKVLIFENRVVTSTTVEKVRVGRGIGKNYIIYPTHLTWHNTLVYLGRDVVWNVVGRTKGRMVWKRGVLGTTNPGEGRIEGEGHPILLFTRVNGSPIYK